MRRTGRDFEEGLCEAPRCSRPAELRVEGVNLCADHFEQDLERKLKAFYSSPEWAAYCQKKRDGTEQAAKAQQHETPQLSTDNFPTLWPARVESQQKRTLWTAQLTLPVGQTDNSTDNRRDGTPDNSSP